MLVELGRRLTKKAVLFPCQDDCAYVTSDGAHRLEPCTLLAYLDTGSQPLGLLIRHMLRQHPRNFGVCRFGSSVWVQDVAEWLTLPRGA
ncbi:MAG TPA: hypothetical protein VFH61_14240 [Thermoleophilia bacterium]|nr:hypothetical protein [Thermoleophilia bacterium]